MAAIPQMSMHNRDVGIWDFKPPHGHDGNFENIEEETDQDVNGNKNTKRKTETDMRIVIAYLVSINELRAVETIPAGELDEHLTAFFSGIKKHDGNEYEPASLRGMLCSIERYLRMRNYPHSITRDIAFLNTRNKLKEKQYILREMAKANKTGKYDNMPTCSFDRLQELYKAKEFGPHSPTAIINSLCFAFFVHLKIRKAVDHKQLLWSDIALKATDTVEYLCYEPVISSEALRTRISGISQYRIYSHSSEDVPWDPVSIYKLYAEKRPSLKNAADSPFYLGTATISQGSCQQQQQQQQQWFKPCPIGVNKLNDLVRMIRDITGAITANSHSNKIEIEDRRERISGSSNDSHIERPVTSFTKNAAFSDVVDTAGDKGSQVYNYQSEDSAMLPNSDEIQGCSDEVDNTSEGDASTSSDNCVQVAKDKIQEVMSSLQPSDRTEVLHWMEGWCHGQQAANTGDDCSALKGASRKLHVSFVLDDSQLTGTDSISSVPATIQVVPRSAEDGDVKKVSNQLRRKPTKTSYSDTFSTATPAADAPETIGDTGPNPAKRRPSANEEGTIDNKVTLPVTSVPAHHGNADEENVGLSDIEHMNMNNVVSMESVAPVYPEVNIANVPMFPFDVRNRYGQFYPPWVYNSRIASLVRNGFIPSYQDFANLGYSDTLKQDETNCKLT